MDTPPVPATSSRALIIMFGLVALLALWLLSFSWHASLLDRYEFRQLQTALSAHWMVEDGWHLNYLTPLFGPPWSVPMEFPTYQVIVAAVHQFTGMPLEQAGRLVSIFFLFACLPALHDLLSLAGLPASRRLIVLAVVITSPVYLFYARTFMIETTALCCSVWFLALFRRSLERPRWIWVVAATCIAVLAALTKITTFLVFGLPALALAIAAWRRSKASLRRLALASLIPAAVSLAIAWWWTQHADAVKDSNPFTGFLTARELRAWNFGPLALRFDWSFWMHLQETINSHNLTEGALTVALLSVPFASKRSRWMAGAALAGFASGPLVFANLYHIHDYYYAANALLLLTAAGLMLAAAWDDPRLPRGTNWFALGLILTFQLHAFYTGYYSHHRHPAPPPPELAAIVRAQVPADGVILIYGDDWNPLLPYYFQRRALMVPGERENETDVLEQVLAQLPPRHIAGMVIHGEKLRARMDFARERAEHFGLALQPVARSESDDLYLPAALRSPDGGVGAPLSPQTPLRLPPADDPAFRDLKPASLDLNDPAIFSPTPVAARSRYGVNLAEVGGRRILNAHAPSELVFHPAPDARQVHAIAGLAEGAYAPGSTAVTDGITIEILAVGADGAKERLYFRLLNPAHNPADRGPQNIELNLPPHFTGNLHFRLGNGPQGDPTNDWAYWARVDIR